MAGKHRGGVPWDVILAIIVAIGILLWVYFGTSLGGK